MPYGTFPPSERCVRLSPHTAQASQRPCEGPVSIRRTCWLHDTRRWSIPFRGREHQWNKATDMCNTFCTDSSVLLVTRHQRDVCPLARRSMLPHGSTPLHLMTRRPSRAPSSCTRSPLGLPCGFLSPQGALRASHVPAVSLHGGGLTSPPVVRQLRPVRLAHRFLTTYLLVQAS